jgi:hypothetical protein
MTAKLNWAKAVPEYEGDDTRYVATDPDGKQVATVRRHEDTPSGYYGAWRGSMFGSRHWSGKLGEFKSAVQAEADRREAADHEGLYNAMMETRREMLARKEILEAAQQRFKAADMAAQLARQEWQSVGGRVPEGAPKPE